MRNQVRFASGRALDVICLGRFAVDFYAQQIGARLEDVTSVAKYLGGSSANTAFGFVNDVAAFSHHPALRRATVDTPNGPVSLAAPPALFSEAARPLGPVPALGEHSAGIRAEFAD